MSDSQSYTLYLSNYTGAKYLVDRSDLANVRFSVDWDSFFNRDNYKYRGCRIRYKFVSDPCTSSTYTYDPANFNAVLVANGIPPLAANLFGGTMIGLMGLATVTYVSNSVSATTTYYDVEDLTSVTGQNIYIPFGIKELGIQIWDNAFGATAAKLASAVSPTNIPFGTWNLMLVFELYDRIEA